MRSFSFAAATLTAAALMSQSSAALTPFPGVATSQLNISVTPSFLSSGIVTFAMSVQKTFSTDLVRFVFHGPSTSPSYPSWSTIYGQNGWNANACHYDAVLGTQGTFIGGGVPADTTGSFDLNTFCTAGVACPGSLVQDCGFNVTAGLLNAANLRYAGKIEVWLNNTDHELNIGFYDIAIELPLNAQAVAGNSLPITVTLNTNLVTVNTSVTGLGLLTSYLMLCPGQDVPQTINGLPVGNLTNAVGVTDVYVGETYCLQHVIPSMPSPVTLTGHTVLQNATEVLLVPAYVGTGLALYNNMTQKTSYGTIVQFYYTFTDRGLNNFSSFVNFSTALTSRLAASPVFIDSLPQTTTGEIVTAAASRRLLGSALALPQRNLLQAPGSAYAQAGAQAVFAPQNRPLQPPPAVPPPPPPARARGFFSF